MDVSDNYMYSVHGGYLDIFPTQCMEVKCERHEKLSQQLRVENSELDLKMEELIAANALLRECNEMMQGKCEGLVEDLSVKEALWSEREETFKAEVST